MRKRAATTDSPAAVCGLRAQQRATSWWLIILSDLIVVHHHHYHHLIVAAAVADPRSSLSSAKHNLLFSHFWFLLSWLFSQIAVAAANFVDDCWLFVYQPTKTVTGHAHYQRRCLGTSQICFCFLCGFARFGVRLMAVCVCLFIADCRPSSSFVVCDFPIPPIFLPFLSCFFIHSFIHFT